MVREDFAQEVEIFFQERPCEDAQSARNALMSLYDYLIQKADEAELWPQGDLRQSCCWFQIQQAMTWSPLRFFWEALVQNDRLAIRAAAKGNICEADGRYWGDPEVGMMQCANLPLMLLGRTTELQDKMFYDQRFQEAIMRWSLSTQGATFTPVLRISIMGLDGGEGKKE